MELQFTCKFHFECPVKITRSDELGLVKGIVFYSELKTQYYLEYKSGDGRAVSGWFYEHEIANQQD